MYNDNNTIKNRIHNSRFKCKCAAPQNSFPKYTA